MDFARWQLPGLKSSSGLNAFFNTRDLCKCDMIFFHKLSCLGNSVRCLFCFVGLGLLLGFFFSSSVCFFHAVSIPDKGKYASLSCTAYFTVAHNSGPLYS